MGSITLALYSDSTWMDMQTTYDIVLQTYFDSLMNTSMGQLIIARNIISNDTSASLSVVNSILTANTSEENEQIVLEIYFNYLNNNFTLTSEEYNTIFGIAIQNPINGGHSVYWARAIIEYEVEDFYLDPPLRNGIPPVSNLTKKIETYIVYPNPAKDEIYISINEHNFDGKILIYNLLGELIETVNLKSGNNYIKLDRNLFTSGIFSYICKDSYKVLGRGKLILID